MECNCKWTEIIIAIIIFIFALWQTQFSQWIVVIAAIVLFIHAFICKNCGVCVTSDTSATTTKAKKKRKK